MNKNRYRRRLLLSGVLFLGFLSSRNLPVVADEALAIIANPTNTTSSLSAGDLHRIFMGDKSSWANGKHILLIMAPQGSPERAAILKSVYKMSEDEYTKYFLQATFTGAVSAPPRDAASEAEIKQLVAANPGAIGYIKSQDVDDSVKVLLKIP
jgi:ABC-type phosphate transport system substrate-binding protein